MDPEELIDVLSRAARTPMPTVPCPRCDRGRVTGPNGESWRCSLCDGMGRVYADQAKGYAQTMSETTPVTEPDQPDPAEQPAPEADPTAPEPEPSEPGQEPEPEQPEPAGPAD